MLIMPLPTFNSVRKLQRKASAQSNSNIMPKAIFIFYWVFIGHPPHLLSTHFFNMRTHCMWCIERGCAALDWGKGKD